MTSRADPLDLDGVVLNHPHDFLRFRGRAPRPGTCFVLMPFSEKFQLVFDTIEDALKGTMLCTRADDPTLGDPILERILTGIAEAELIIADLTDQNANVFYELAIAQTMTKDVMLLARSIDDDVPFDLKHFFCKRYSVDSRQGLAALKKDVQKAAELVRARGVPTTLRSGIDRTRLIVDYMTGLSKRRRQQRPSLIRAQASITSLGNIGRGDSLDPDELEYGRLLEQERALILGLIQRGSGFRAVICPERFVAGTERPEQRHSRIEKVIKFLSTDNEYLDRCEVVVSPMAGPNLLFFDEEILFEGYKTGVESGFGCTLTYTDAGVLKIRCEVFDDFFRSARDYTIEKYCSGDGSLEALRSGVTEALMAARK